jgi:hypothetical protein
VKAPALSPQGLRDVTVRDYLRDSARFGAPMTRTQAERLAVRDCEIYDAVTRARVDAPAAPDPAKVAEKAALLDAEAAAVGAEVMHAPLESATRRSPVATLHKRHRPDSRMAFAKGRIRRILEGVSPHKDLTKACSTATIPDLALEVMKLYINLATRGAPRRPTDEPNPFFGMSEHDASRMAQAILEGICDRSSGRMGPWWVPK